MSPGKKKKKEKQASGEFFWTSILHLWKHTHEWTCVCVSWGTERLLCHPTPSLCPGIRKRANGTGGGDRRRGRSRRGQRGIQCVSAHRPFLSRQTGTLKHSHTCICLCLAWGARTPTLLSWQLHKCLKWDTRQFLLQHIIANNLPCKVIINALLDM